ncbi:phage tail tape measure protein [Prosthecomicrobium hirschii]|nr:phage tail tape measure protein [Prosthecomicrobium hirschii]
MGDIRSTLTMQLLNQVSGPAARMRRDLHELDATARKAQGRRTLGGGPGSGIGSGSGAGLVAGVGAAGTVLAGSSRMLAGAIGGYAAGSTAFDGYRRFADFERRLTRVGLTADATAGMIARARPQLKATAREVGLTQSEVLGGVEALVAAGRSLPDAMAFLPSVARTAQAAGAEIVDIANSADALGTSLKIPAKSMQQAFDILVAGGKAGKFELKDMARYLPSLAPAAAAIGMSGTEGLRKMVAMLQVIRAQTGSAEEAAASANNIFAKMESEETAKKFSKMGVDLRKEMTKARQEGRDLLEVFLDLSTRALKGDLSKLPQLFQDMEFARGMRALLAQRGELQRLGHALRSVDGTTLKDLGQVSGDAAAGLKRLTDAWDTALRSLGRLADSAGVSSLLSGLGSAAESAATSFDHLGRSIGALGEGRIRDGVRDLAKAVEDPLRFLGGERGGVLGAVQDRIDARMDNEVATKEARLKQMIGVFETTAKRIDEKYRGRTIPAEIARMREQAVADMMALQAEIARLKSMRQSTEIGGRLPGLQPYGSLDDAGPLDIPKPPAPPTDRLPIRKPTPEQRRAPWSGTVLPTMPVAPLDDPTRGLPETIRQNGEAAVAEAKAIAARIQAAFDAVHPVIRPRVEAPSGFNGGFAPPGNYGDDGGRR